MSPLNTYVKVFLTVVPNQYINSNIALCNFAQLKDKSYDSHILFKIIYNLALILKETPCEANKITSPRLS